MKRRALVVLPLVVAAGTWLLGRAPTESAVEKQCARFQEARRERERGLREEISREVEEKTASLRARIGVAVGVSLGAVVLAIWALVR